MDEQKKQLNAPEREEETLKFWETKKIFEKSLKKNKGKKTFVFYEGPPTANGMPGIHHVEARAFKDAVLRYKSMQGFNVPRRAGWDTHGLPVEIQVEKKLGFKTKHDIENYGIARFNTDAKRSVWEYKEEWERLTKRMGFWIDLKNPYITYETSYIETLWRIISEFHKKGLLYEDFKVVPWCPRCQTGLSSHEVGLGYKEVEDTSVYVKFKLKPGQKIGDFTTDDKTYILSWTTTPWTLPGNVGLAVGESIEYRIVRRKIDDTNTVEFFIAAVRAEGKIDWDSPSVDFVNPIIQSKELVGLKYEPLFDVPELKRSDMAYKIYAADFVSATEGTGIVHTAVMYGEDDYKLGQQVGLPKHHTVTEDGKFVGGLGELSGLSVKAPETTKKILDSLGDKIFHQEQYKHEYPHCWRCDTPLLYYARKAWWVKTTAVKKELLANNETINWVPEHLKHGRFGEFLRDVRDWCFSRERYWGTPLPIWKCEKKECGEIEVIGSRVELIQRIGTSKNRYFIMRHAEAENNARKIYSCAWPEPKKHHLTSRGKRQAERAAQKLKQEKIDLIVASPFTRTKETAQIVSSVLGVGVSYDERLREMFWGMRHDISAEEGDRIFAAMKDPFIEAMPGGETFSDVRNRMYGALSELEANHSGKNILIVSHGDPLSMLEASVRGLSDEETIAFRKDHSAIRYAETREIPYYRLPRDETGTVNLHRPYVDEIKFDCASCDGVMRRTPEVADVWFDSGAMPFAQSHYPFNKKEELAYPADYISEAVDQTRGWFYSMLAVATLLGRKAPYKNVISLGHVLDAKGQKMSKSKGNVVSPQEMMDKYGVDALRWYFFTINGPGEPKRFEEKDVALRQRGFVATLWNGFVFWDTYVTRIKNFTPTPNFGVGAGESRIKSTNVLDQWILARLNVLVGEVTDALDKYDLVRAARAIDEFTISDFSQWYVRRSRRRFQHPESAQEKNEAAYVFAEVLASLVELVAPFAPFVSEAVYQGLRKKMRLKEESVHLRRWPKSEKKKRDAVVIKDMETVRQTVAEALKLRAGAGIKVRQPLRGLRIKNEELKEQKDLLDLIRDEVNVKEIFFGGEMKLDTEITPELKEGGIVREFVRTVQDMRRDLGMHPGEKMRCQIMGSERVVAILVKWEREIKKDISAEDLKAGGKRVYKLEREFDLDGEKLWIGIWK